MIKHAIAPKVASAPGVCHALAKPGDYIEADLLKACRVLLICPYMLFEVARTNSSAKPLRLAGFIGAAGGCTA